MKEIRKKSAENSISRRKKKKSAGEMAYVGVINQELSISISMAARKSKASISISINA